MNGSRHDTNFLIKAFEAQFTQAVVVERETPGHGFVHCALDANATMLRYLLDALSQHDARARDGPVGNDDFAHRNANPHDRPDRVLDLRERGGIVGLKGESRTQGIRTFTKLGYERVASHLMRDAAVTLDAIGKPVEGRPHAFMRETFVRLHEQSRPHHIGVQNDG